VNLKKI